MKRPSEFRKPLPAAVALAAAAVLLLSVLVLVFGWRRETPQKQKPPAPPAVSVTPDLPASAPSVPLPETDAAWLHGDLDPAKDERFARLPDSYSNKPVYVHREVLPDLRAMIDAARRDGIRLEVISGFRSYDYQRGIWARKWQAAQGSDREKILQIMQYSAYPGLSRHHWGTDVDFNSVENAYWDGAEGQAVSAWLRNNAPQYGFCEVYKDQAAGKRQGGYRDEPWHWSFVEVAKPLQQQSVPLLADVLSRPLPGSETAQALADVLRPYLTATADNCWPDV